MANISASEVNKLRQITGSGMMDCKNALVEADGDIEAAIDILRKKGMKVANKRADRDANEGIVMAETTADHSFAAVIMLNCETDFVAKNEEFQKLAKDIMNLAITVKPASLEDMKNLKIDNYTVAENIMNMTGKTGEKMDLAHYHFIESPSSCAYNHHGNRLATIIGLSKPGFEELGKELCMQAAAMAPIAVDKDDVSQETIDREIEIGKDQARQEGKAEEMLEKIAVGKLQKFFKENTLLNQDFIKETKVTVRDHIAKQDKDLKVSSFNRVMLGA
ncbi:MAG: translation elongation factor Ts [Bacteroidota bacterium]